MGVVWSQTFPSSAPLTEATCPVLDGKVIVITGGTSGCGFELAKIVYAKGASVYLSARSHNKGQKAVREIQESCPESLGKVDCFLLEFDDLAKIKAGADAFKAKADRVDVLYNNAGVAAGVAGARSAQNIDIHLAVNILGPFLFTHYLMPELKASHGSRVIWSTSMIVDANPIKGGLVLEELDNPSSDYSRNYGMSKVGNWLLASEFARRNVRSDIVSVAQNPGNLSTPIWKDQSKILRMMMYPVLWAPIYGAYTMLYAGLSEEVTKAQNGSFIIPCGRLHPQPREDVLEAFNAKEDGGTGLASDFWGWCESKCRPFM
ncbi:MAG: hypothetical protein M1828_000513 [Chrysothrix sp. TS-e1954]|nr:MAG: hypothetical protein M1828_000513 [Chrysothrix sp. TS-e1954]